MSSLIAGESITTQSYCTFHTADVICGIPVKDVREIVSDLFVTPVPRSNHMIAGLINLRGQILTVIDMMCWLGRSDARREGAGKFHLITDVGGETVSLQVDEMGPVISSDLYQLESVPKHIDHQIADRLISVARLADSLVLILQTDKMKEIRSIQTAAKVSWESSEVDSGNDQSEADQNTQEIQ